ncbi:MAG: hypothetical protein R3F49_16360 [Planctomycetota bacterium]
MTRALVAIGVITALGLGLALLNREPSPPPSAPGGGGEAGSTALPAELAGRSELAAPNAAATPSAPDGAAAFTRSGRVVDAAGEGVGGLSVAVVMRPAGLGGPMSDGGQFPARTVTDADGRFELSLPYPGSMWVGPLAQLDVRHQVLGAPVRAEFSAAAAGTPLELRVRESKTAAGVVSLAAAPGLRAKDVRVVAIGEQSGHSALSALTDDGSFVIGPLFDETYFYVASAPGFVSRSRHGVASGTQGLELTLEPIGALRVQVEGGPRPGLRVECSPEGGTLATLARMTVIGRSMNFLLPGPHSIAAYTQDEIGYAHVTDIGSKEAPLDVQVALGPAASLRVSNDADSPRILVVEEGGKTVRVQTISLAGQTVMIVPPGALTVRAYALPGDEIETQAFQLAPGQRGELRLTLPAQ